MILLRIFCIICALTYSQTELLSLYESKSRAFGFSNQQPQYHLFYGRQQNRSHEEKSFVPQEYKTDREDRYDLDFWENHEFAFKKNQTYSDKDYTFKNYHPLREYETADHIFSEPTVQLFKTKGRGKASVHRRGETVYVPNELGRKRAHTGTVSVRVVDKNENELKTNKYRGGCRECPSDQTVVAPKGNLFVLLPEPCAVAPRMWNHHSGPKPGSKIQEGVHIVRGRIGPKKKFCEYRFQVLVNRCEQFKVKDEAVNMECSAENAWGSICIISCGEGKEPLGPTELECREDLTWSNQLPVCKSRTDCPTSKIKTKSKISCQTANMSYSENEHLPNGSTCTFRQNGKDISITCKDGRWLKFRKSKTFRSKQNNQDGKQTITKNDACNPNPCQNGGTCLKPDSGALTPICKCRPQTQGARCELRECYYNTCENEGICIYQNEKPICYCSSEYGGDRCQNYRNV